MRRIKYFKKHPKIRGAVTSANNIKVGDMVVMHGRGHPKAIVTKVDMSKYPGGSVWYDVRLKNGKVITRRSWDFLEVWR